MSELEEFLQECLPDGARLESVVREKQVFVVAFSDASGVRRTVEFWEKCAHRRSYRSGVGLAFAYRTGAHSLGSFDVEQRVIATWLEHEDRLFGLSRSFVEKPAGPPLPGRVVFLRETHLARRILRAWPRTGSVHRAVHDLLGEECVFGERVEDVQLYFESRCAQACEFCEEPIIRERLAARVVSRLLAVQHDCKLDIVSSGFFRVFVDVVSERRLPMTITGHDWTRHPHCDALLRILETHARTRLRLQGPSLALDSMDLARRIAALPGLEWIATTLQSSDSAEHDAMVGLTGAHARLLQALENLETLGVRVQLTLVLTRRALGSLPTTLGYLHNRGWTIELAAFVPDRAMGDVSDKLAPIDELRTAIASARPEAREVVRGFVGVPACAVPEGLRNKVAPVLRTNERAAMQFGLSCADCTARLSCAGVPGGYLGALGTRGMIPIRG